MTHWQELSSSPFTASLCFMGHEYVCSATSSSSNTGAAVGNTSDYYSSIDTSLTGAPFRAQLTSLVSQHKSLTYEQLWQAFLVLDENLNPHPNDCKADQITDLYSATCWTPNTQQCGKQEV